MKIHPTIERMRRELMTARNVAYGQRDWLRVAEITAQLSALPVKGSKGNYVVVED